MADPERQHEQRDDDQEISRWQQFGAWLASLRHQRDLKQAEVAARANMSAEMYKVLERGGLRRVTDGPWEVPNPKDNVFYNLARVLGVDAEELFERVGHYEDRPKTKRSGRRRPRGGVRQDKLAELEARIAALEARLPADSATGTSRRSRRASG
jgi:transcriptional regulator with XRE-family HTH domain